MVAPNSGTGSGMTNLDGSFMILHVMTLWAAFLADPRHLQGSQGMDFK